MPLISDNIHGKAPEVKKLKVKTLFKLEFFKFKQWVQMYLKVKKVC